MTHGIGTMKQTNGNCMLTPISPGVPLIFEDDFEFDQSTIIDIFQGYESNPEFKNFKGLEIGDAGSSTPEYEKSPHKLPELAEFTAWALERATEICKTWGYGHAPTIRHSWANKHGYGGWTKPHTHPQAHLVLAAYVQAEENSGDLFITDPLEHHWFGLPSKLGRSKFRDWKLPVKSNKVYFFSPFLRHETGFNESESDRWVISYNFTCWPEGYNP